MRDHSHLPSDDSGLCQLCGQPLPVTVPAYGARGPNRTGLAVTVLLHLLVVAIYLFQPERPEQRPPPPAGGTIVYLSPLPPKARPQQQQPKPAPKKAVKSAPVKMQRLPNTITLPEEKPVQAAEPAPVAKAEPAPPEMDMADYIEARRKQRGAASAQPAEESDAERGNRIANANIAAANARGTGDEVKPAMFELSNQTFSSAVLKFRGWNPNFKRRWLKQDTVELGNQPDMETAIVNKMIEVLRREFGTDYFNWVPDPPRAKIRMSLRVEDTATLQAFLFRETFPEYKPRPR